MERRGRRLDRVPGRLGDRASRAGETEVAGVLPSSILERRLVDENDHVVWLSDSATGPGISSMAIIVARATRKDAR